MSVNDDELTRIRAARQAEIQQQIEAQAEHQVQAEAQEAAAEQEANVLALAMRTILTPEARDRLARVELGHSDLATSVKQHLYTLHQSNQIQTPVNEEMLKRILQGISQNNRRETTIRRI
ncbi:MAG: DNA-binding protein [Candidatus Thalassarchaeaceae archaeon]|jgi:programmed cell death protein 5|nr:DNA-binding protein [Candidatus Thalassarchaeaceae archaeon]